MTYEDLLRGLPGCENAAAVAPNDGTDLPGGPTRCLYIGVAGDVKVDLVGVGAGIVFKAVPVGILNVRAKRVYAAGTAATNIVALW
jgi:hypothetical protein